MQTTQVDETQTAELESALESFPASQYPKIAEFKVPHTQVSRKSPNMGFDETCDTCGEKRVVDGQTVALACFRCRDSARASQQDLLVTAGLYTAFSFARCIDHESGAFGLPPR